MKICQAVLDAHAQFGGDLELMQKAYEWHDLKREVETLRSALSAQVQDVAEYERHADYLEVMADVIMDSEMAGKLEAKLTMEKAAKFIRSHLPAAPAKQEG